MPTYNPPPNWPAPPPGWIPPAGWKAPANWPPPPNGWQFWLPDKKKGSWFGRHKILTGVGGGLAALLLIGSVASAGDDQTPNATAASTPSASPTATAPAPESTPSKPEPTEEPTQAPQPEPMTYSGSGDEVVKFKKALTEPMLITTTWTGVSDNNTIYAYDADGNEGDLLVNTIGSYQGTNIINLYDGDNVKALKIEGSGNWKITLKPLADAKSWDGSGTYKGKAMT
jgi:hypothetical protein